MAESTWQRVQRWWQNRKKYEVKIDHPRMTIIGRFVREQVDDPPYIAFFCIPYACPPIKHLRFQVGHPIIRTKLVIRNKNAHRCCFHVSIFQPPRELPQNDEYVRYKAYTKQLRRCIQIMGCELEGSEDCLYLNVFMPTVSD